MSAYDYEMNFELFLFLQPGISDFLNTLPELKFEVFTERIKLLLIWLWKIIY